MNESELRALIRDVIARRQSEVTGADVRGGEGVRLVREHSSHAMFTLPAGMDSDGPCLIEPAVMCNHCGYCKSYGH